jgi:hypothetical protein
MSKHESVFVGLYAVENILFTVKRKKTFETDSVADDRFKGI